MPLLQALLWISLCWPTVLGSVCVVPTTHLCNVTYLVPPSVAAIAAVLESEISSEVNTDSRQSISEECAKSLREVRCAKSFPRCSANSSQVTVTSLDCERRLQCATSTYRTILKAGYFCNLTEQTFPLSECVPLARYNYSFRYCPVDVARNVSEWMFALIRYQDLSLSSSAYTFLRSNYPECAQTYDLFQCTKIGQCAECGSTANMFVNYTQGQCRAFSSLCVHAGNTIPDCNLWPVEVKSPQCNDSTANITRGNITDVIGMSSSTYSLQTTLTGGAIATPSTDQPSTSSIVQASIIVAIAVAIIGGIALFVGTVLIIVAATWMRKRYYSYVAPVAEDGKQLQSSLSGSQAINDEYSSGL